LHVIRIVRFVHPLGLIATFSWEKTRLDGGTKEIRSKPDQQHERPSVHVRGWSNQRMVLSSVQDEGEGPVPGNPRSQRVPDRGALVIALVRFRSVFGKKQSILQKKD